MVGHRKCSAYQIRHSKTRLREFQKRDIVKTYICWANEFNVINDEVCICSYKLLVNNHDRSFDPFIIPVGVSEILKFVSWMQDY
jgi:hypothetical protein